MFIANNAIEEKKQCIAYKVRILVMDDEEMIRNLLDKMLCRLSVKWQQH